MDKTARTFIDHVERDLLEAKHLLQAGLKTALECVAGRAEEVSRSMTTQAIGKLRVIENLSENSINVMEKHLGRLNFLDAHGRIKNVADFDELAQSLSEALADARATLDRVAATGEQELGNATGAIREAWRNLHVALDSARLELALARKDSEEEAGNLRRELNEKFEEAIRVAQANDHETLHAKLFDISRFLASKLGEKFKILFGFQR